MAHPFAEHRQTKKEHSRVGHIVKGYKSGGAVHSDEKQDRKLIKSMMKKELHADGEKSKHRADRPRRAKGGKVKRADGGDVSPVKIGGDAALAEAQRRHDQAIKEGRSSTLTGQLYRVQGEQPSKRAKGGGVKGKHNAKTIVNVITGGHPAGGAVPPMPAPPAGLAGAAMPPPPMAAKPPMPMGPPPGAAPSGPPPMPMRAKGGRTCRADGGSAGKMPTPQQIVNTNRSRPVPSAKESSDAMKSIEDKMRARGGKVTNGNAWAEGLKNGTKVQHMRGKGDLEQMGRGKQVTFKSGGKVRSFYAKGGTVKNKTDPGVNDRLHMGEKFKASPMEIRANDSNTTNDPTIGRPNRAAGGKVESPQGVSAATKMPGGSGGGEARLFKERREARR